MEESLFEGMDFVLSVAPEQDGEREPSPPVSAVAEAPPPPVESSSRGALDEDLFTGMSMLSISSSQEAADSSGNGEARISLSDPSCMGRKSFDTILAAYDSAPSAGTKATSTSTISISSRGGAGRKKKKSLRIGYGRDNEDGEDREMVFSDQAEIKKLVHASEVVELGTSFPESDGVSVSASEFSQQEMELEIEDGLADDTKVFKEDTQVFPKEDSEIAREITKAGDEKEEKTLHASVEESKTVVLVEAARVVETAPEVEDNVDTNDPKSSTVTLAMRRRLEAIQEDIARKLRDLEAKAAEASSSRKMAAQVRRRAAEELSSTTAKRKALEVELESACEREDFDLADRLSQEVSDAEKSLELADVAFKEADSKYDLAAVEMETIVSLKISIEEEGAAALAEFQKEAQAAAEKVEMEASETARLEMESLTSKEEELDMKSTQYLLELRALEEAKVELNRTIDEAVEPDVRDKTGHLAERQVLVEELEDLLRKVKDKESEIARRDNLIKEIDLKIAAVAATFEEKQLSIETDLSRVTSSLEALDTVSAGIQSARKDVEESLTMAEAEGECLKTTAEAAQERAIFLQEELGRWRKAAKLSREIKEKKGDLVRKEEELLADSQALRQQASEARASLQELSATKMKLQEDIRAAKQKLAHHEKRGPALEAEKRLAAATRKFKEAARLSAEAKAFRAEQEAVTEELQKCSSELQQVEERIETKIVSLSNIEGLIAVKEREAAQACCERLRLVAVAARNERNVAIELDDIEEAESLQAEAVAADAEADELQRIHQFQSAFQSLSAEGEDRDGDAVEN
ncbi:myosin heavy chain, cardiac muscle isoform-like [Selaginella moellendorffii]|uniref:myosin heavy chain, cardiac muscle isoform-like n=1 Tax=Selaginella moellendorffii TaxID=88036 RepID=UPI000D1CF2D2|nr:myosin heavy chain, cardiac muscle isoform-like [Selaginella moellendorffii]|eukprot:XP_024543556.1 myosin heavy chain, cardiac muscle isoform-like [Selaginella moellendorffii]